MPVGSNAQWEENIDDMATDLDAINTNIAALAARHPTATATQAANTAANTVVKNAPGTLWSATVTTLGTAALSIYDNASTNSGTILLTIPASAPVGTVYQWNSGQPAANGITSAGVLNCPAVTFAYS